MSIKLTQWRVDVLQARFSWELNGADSDIMQTAYCLSVAKDKNFNQKYNMAKWLKDLFADQYPDRKVPFVIPNV